MDHTQQTPNIMILSVHGMKPELIDFPIPELLSLSSMHQTTPQISELLQNELLCINVKKPYECRNNLIKYLPFIRLSYPTYKNYPDILQNDDPLYHDLNQICDRSVLTQSFVLVLAQGANYKDLKNNVSNDHLLKSYTQDENQKLSFQCFCANRQVSREEQVEKIDFTTDYFEMKGTIDIKNSNRCYWLCEYHEPFDTACRPAYDDTLKQVFFGVQIAYNRKSKRHYTSNFELPLRIYLGPTSTSAPLAFLMANQAQIQPDQIVLDPFVGTGGLLVPAAYFGAITFGSDIDARVIHGHGVGHLNKLSNFKITDKPQKPFMYYNFRQYNLSLPNLVRQDCLKDGFRREFFDVIICDPPYGIRAASRVTGKKIRQDKTIQDDVEEGEEQQLEESIQQQEEIQQEQETEILTQDQDTIDIKPSKEPKKPFIIPTKKIDHLMIYEQLFKAASAMLKPGGMFVYLYPFDRAQGPATLVDVPTHAMFDLLNYSEEKINLSKSRILITMRKKQI